MEDLFTQIRDNLIALEEETAAKQEELVRYNDYIEQAKAELKGLHVQIKDITVIYQANDHDFTERIEVLKLKIERLQSQAKALVDKKATIQVEYTRLSQQNVQFRSYEAKAKHALQTMEKSLIERERIVREREQLKPFTTSLLPKD